MNGVFLLLRLMDIPPAYSAIPASSECRIFNRALSQGSCGACSAFAVSTVLAMRACLDEGRDYIPSPYRLFDCADGDCEAGLSIPRAMAVARYGIEDIDESEKRYGKPCNLKWERQISMHIKPRIFVDVDDIQRIIILHGPVLGIMRSESTENGNHATVIVGWKPDSWIIQNSWGDTWGFHNGIGFTSIDSVRYAIDVDADSARTLHWEILFILPAAGVAALVVSIVHSIKALERSNDDFAIRLQNQLNQCSDEE